MNYRHQFHAGNFADVMKHALLVQLVRAMQAKEKGFLFLDTHAGRGSYDLAAAERGDSLARKPEWPDGVGRVTNATEVGAALADYLDVVHRFDRERGNQEDVPRFYPGSPMIVRMLARVQDRLALCERHPEERAALAEEFWAAPRTAVHEIDGYRAMRAMLPPPERRALVLIDPPYEAKDEFAEVVAAVQEGLGRLPAGVFAIWYPLTERARVDRFFDELKTLALPPTAVWELTIAGESAAFKMRGCGLVVINPPWRFERVADPMLAELARRLAQAPGAETRTEWLVAEK